MLLGFLWPKGLCDALLFCIGCCPGRPQQKPGYHGRIVGLVYLGFTRFKSWHMCSLRITFFAFAPSTPPQHTQNAYPLLPSFSTSVLHVAVFASVSFSFNKLHLLSVNLYMGSLHLSQCWSQIMKESKQI